MNEQTRFLQEGTDRFWVERGLELKDQTNRTTGPDPYQNMVQVGAVKRYLNESDHILDVGCGLGDNTIEFARIVTHATGLELSESLYQLALRARDQAGVQNVEFIQGDIRHFVSEEKFDKVVSVQCLINLMDNDDQKVAVGKIYDVLRDGGLYLMLEPSKQALESLNVYRRKFGLPSIEESAHNNNFDEDALLEFMQDRFNLLEKNRTLATYYFLSRVFHPLYVSPEQPQYDSKVNKIAAHIALELPDISDIECSPLYVFQKKG